MPYTDHWPIQFIKLFLREKYRERVELTFSILFQKLRHFTENLEIDLAVRDEENIEENKDAKTFHFVGTRQQHDFQINLKKNIL